MVILHHDQGHEEGLFLSLYNVMKILKMCLEILKIEIFFRLT